MLGEEPALLPHGGLEDDRLRGEAGENQPPTQRWMGLDSVREDEGEGPPGNTGGDSSGRCWVGASDRGGCSQLGGDGGSTVGRRCFHSVMHRNSDLAEACSRCDRPGPGPSTVGRLGDTSGRLPEWTGGRLLWGSVQQRTDSCTGSHGDAPLHVCAVGRPQLLRSTSR